MMTMSCLFRKQYLNNNNNNNNNDNNNNNNNNNNIIDADFSFKIKTNLLLSTTHFTCFYDPTRMLGKYLTGVG